MGGPPPKWMTGRLTLSQSYDMSNHLEPPAWPPDEPRPEELLPVEDEAGDDDATEEGPAVAAPWPAAAVRGVGLLPLPRCARSGSCLPTPSEPRTTGSGVAGRPAGFAGPDVAAPAEGARALAAVGPVDAWSALAVSVTSFVDVAVSVDVTGGEASALPLVGSVDVTCAVWAGVSVDVTGGETSAFPVLMAGAASAGPAVVAVAGAEALTSGSRINAAAVVAFAWTGAVAAPALANCHSVNVGRPKIGAIES